MNHIDRKNVTLFRRYVWLLDTICRARRITFAEINAKWIDMGLGENDPIPKKTFHNHLHAIRDIFDITVGCDRSVNEYYIEDEWDSSKAGEALRWMLSAFLVKNLIAESPKLGDRIQFDPIPAGLDFVTTIVEAMSNGTAVAITYRRSYIDAPREYEALEPYVLKAFRQRWYMVARNPAQDKLMIFALDRMDKVTPTDRKFTLPKEFDAGDYFRKSFGITVEPDRKAEIIKLKVYGNQADYIRALPLHFSQTEIEKQADYSIFEYFLTPTNDFVRELLSHGRELVVLEPTSLREEMKAAINGMRDLYRTK